MLTGNIKYGYKYYGKGVTATKKDDPTAFWLGISVYGVIAITSSVMILIAVSK